MCKIIAAERQKEILKLLHDNGSVKIGQLADYFEVSRETISRDLSYLTEIGAAQRSHGGLLPFMNLAIFQLKLESIKMRILRRNYAKKL